MRIQPGYSEDTVSQDTVRIQPGYSEDTVRIQQGYSQDTAGVQSGYSQSTAGVQWGIVGTSRGTVVVGWWEDLSRKQSIKITQKLVYVFYIYCNIEPRTSTT